MSTTAICRACVVTDVKMLVIDKELHEIYERITKTKLRFNDGMPQTVCFICYSQLQRCRQFSETALQSESLLKTYLDNDIVTQNRPSPCLDLQIVENICVTVARSDNTPNDEPEDRHTNNYVCITEQQPIEIKIEVEVKQEYQDEDIFKTEEITVEETEATNLKKNVKSQSDERPFNCDQCKNKYKTRYNLLVHNIRMHRDEQPSSPKFTCHICSFKFTKAANLKQHIYTHSDERPFLCDQCTSKFKTPNGLKRHIKNSHVQLEKKYPCELCSKSFAQLTNYKIHLKVHEGTKRFACDLCGKAFYAKQTLKSHMRCHTGERPFHCNTCGMSFGFKCSLKLHIKRMHVEVKEFPCSLCPSSFKHEMGLAAHMKLHTAEKTYACDKCSKAFTAASYLYRHNMQVHAEGRNYECTKCKKAFKTRNNLSHHLKRVKCKAKQATENSV